MATLTYWVCECLDDHHAYNIRTKTKKEAQEKRRERGEDNYGEPRKNVIHYKDAFDLMENCLSENHAGE
jgi:hypothetical protein